MGQTQRIRSDGWTAERQLRFLETLAQTRSVSRAAAAAAMSRTSAYRLRERREGALFAALWDRVLAPDLRVSEIHTRQLTNDRLMGLLGTHYRRKRGDYSTIGSAEGKSRATHPTRPL